jgi:hypothetical protein
MSAGLGGRTPRSAFHAEHTGRAARKASAVDVSCDGLSLEELAMLCWEAGFDWVYNEKGGRSGGPHVHASVRR